MRGSLLLSVLVVHGAFTVDIRGGRRLLNQVSTSPNVSTWTAAETSLRAQLLSPLQQNAPLGANLTYSYDKYAEPVLHHPERVVSQSVWHGDDGRAFNCANGTASRQWNQFCEAIFVCQVGMQLFGVAAVDDRRGIASLTGWLQLSWEDPRLRWNSSAPQAVEQIVFAADQSVPSNSDIFVPDIAPTNGLQDWNQGLTNTPAKSDGKGYVTWGRRGTIRANCSFDSADFPFDKPRCSIALGSLSMSRQLLALQLEDPMVFGGLVASSAVGGGEYSISSARWSKVGAGAPGGISTQAGPWDAVVVEVTLQRAWRYYWTRAMVPQILLSLLSFAAFWCGPGCQERLIFLGVLILTSVVLRGTLRGRLPVVKEQLLIVSFFESNLLFMVFAVLESAFVVMLFNKTDENLTPKVWQRIYGPLLRKMGYMTTAGEPSELELLTSGTSSSSGAQASVHVLLEASPPGTPQSGDVLLDEIILEGTTAELTEQEPLTPRHPSGAASGHATKRSASGSATGKDESLSKWLRRIGYEAYEEVFRKNGISTLRELSECYLSEQDLLNDIGIQKMLPRRRLLSHLRALAGQKDEGETVATALQSLKDGLVGHKDVRLQGANMVGAISHARVGGSSMQPSESKSTEEKMPKPDPRRQQQMLARAKQQIRSELHKYWAGVARKVDLAAQVIFPIAFAVSMASTLAPYSGTISG